jgi:hypothetical protein
MSLSPDGRGRVRLAVAPDAAPPELRARAARDPLAPEDEQSLLRYVVYLGLAYLEGERAVADAADEAEAYARLSRLCAAAEGGAAVLRFTYAEESRRFAEEQRAAAAHGRMADAYAGLVDSLRAEIAVREQRVAALRRALA